jgi:hypothetical protein
MIGCWRRNDETRRGRIKTKLERDRIYFSFLYVLRKFNYVRFGVKWPKSKKLFL